MTLSAQGPILCLSAPELFEVAMVAVASPDELKALDSPLILDMRDPEEVTAGKGGPPSKIDGSINVPLNMDGVKQSVRVTTIEEFTAKLTASGVSLPEDKTKAIITH